MSGTELSLLEGLLSWQLAAGLALFLLGMERLEEAVNTLAGRAFRDGLRRVTGHPFQSVLFGLVGTGLLQSSSILGLMVLAFVGAGILPMRNALGVILGANIGSTLTGWLVAAVGFELDLEAMSLPLIALGAFGTVFARRESPLAAWGALLLALGFLLFGMQNMVVAANGVAQGFDPAQLAGYPPVAFFLAGIVITAIVRTSAATIMMALSAMNAGLLSLEQAAAIAIGADLGTTSTLLIAVIKGSASKRQVAAFHLLFNGVSNTIAFFLLLPHVGAIVAFYGISDPLFGLTAFHTTFNVLGVLLFYPLLGRIAAWLSLRFAGEADTVARFLPQVPATETAAAIAATRREVGNLLHRTQRLALRALKVELPPALADGARETPLGALLGGNTTFGDDYEDLKRLEGEVLAYTSRLQAAGPHAEDAGRIGRLVIAARDAVIAAKAVKDVRPDLVEFRHAGDGWLGLFSTALKDSLAEMHAGLAALPAPGEGAADAVAAALAGIQARMEQQHDALKASIYAEALQQGLGELALSTALNVLHELHAANRALLRAARVLWLDELAE